MADIIDIAKKYSIRIKDNKFCLDDIAQRIVESKNLEKYMKKIVGKEKIDKLYYVNEDSFRKIVSGGKSLKCKAIRELLNDKDKLVVKKKMKLIIIIYLILEGMKLIYLIMMVKFGSNEKTLQLY